jgi:hypothetical protein
MAASARIRGAVLACSVLVAGCEFGGNSVGAAVDASAPEASPEASLPQEASEDGAVTDAAAFPPWDGAASACMKTSSGVDCKSGDPGAPAFEVVIPTDGMGVVSINVQTSEPASGFVGVCLANQASLYATPMLPALCYSVGTGAGSGMDGGGDAASAGDAGGSDNGSAATQTDWATFTVAAATAASYPYYETCGLPGGCAQVSHSCCSPPVALIVSGSSATGRVTSIFPGASD